MIQKQFDEMLKEIRVDAHRALASFNAPISLEVGRSPNYEELLAGQHDGGVDVAEMREVAHAMGRVLVSARGGSGKTTLMRRLLVTSLDAGDASVHLELRGWTPDDTNEMNGETLSPIRFFDRLLKRFSRGAFSAQLLDFLPTGTKKLIILDGLNETPGKTADAILTACDEAAAVFPGLAVVATDRLARRKLSNPDRWAMFTVLPISDEEIERHRAEGDRELLRSPFFFDKALGGDLRETPESTILQMISGHTSLSAEQIQALKKCAFDIYTAQSSRTFSNHAIPLELATPLIEAGLLAQSGDASLSFSHHAIHDSLASMYVASDDKLWAPETRKDAFNAITFNASSFDAIASLLRVLFHLGDMEKTSELLRAVYDWNPYAAGYALVEAESSGSVQITRGMRAVVLFMLALRLFDHQKATQQKSRDALIMFKDELPKELLRCQNPTELIELARSQDFKDETYKAWLETITMTADALEATGAVEDLSDHDSVRSWTLANVLKFTGSTARLEERLIELSTDPNPTVRWRSVHALGAAETESAAEALFDRLLENTEESEDVRYGAVRSLVEMALMRPELRASIVAGLNKRIDQLRNDSRIIGEFVRAAFADPAISNEAWAEALTPIFHNLIDLSESASEIEHWSGQLANLYAQYEPEAA